MQNIVLYLYGWGESGKLSLNGYYYSCSIGQNVHFNLITVCTQSIGSRHSLLIQQNSQTDHLSLDNGADAAGNVKTDYLHSHSLIPNFATHAGSPV